MICPACKTNNASNQAAQYCIQCGSDLHVHRLLQGLREKIQMKSEITEPNKAITQSPKGFLWVWKTVPIILLLILTVWSIFVGMRLLAFLDHEDANRAAVYSKWTETGLEQLQQMSTIIHKELDLILDQRRENQALQEKFKKLIAITASKIEEKKVDLPLPLEQKKP